MALTFGPNKTTPPSRNKDSSLEMDDEETALSTTRYLRSTLPFDSGNAILFVTGASLNSTDTNDGARESQPRTNGTMTGEEARGFYEEVLALSEQDKASSHRGSTRPRRKQKKKKPSMVANTDLKNHARPSESPSSPLQLFQYAQNNQLDLLQSALVNEHHDVNLQDNFHWTLLMVAACAGHMTVVEYLMGRGARWREYTEQGMNAADLARMRGHLEIAEFIETYDSTEGSTAAHDEEEINCQFCSTKLSQTGQKRHTGSKSDKSRQKKSTGAFYCDSCETTVHQSERQHATSISHLYSSQWQPSSAPSYGIPQSNRGFQMMLRSGWDPERGLGSRRQGKVFPVKTVLKQDRSGIGLERGKPRVTHFSAHDKAAVQSRRKQYRKEQPSKRKKDIVQEKQKERQWERRLRTMMNIEDSNLLA